MTMRENTTRLHRRSNGFSLIEVLVALTILSIGLLGIAMLQVYGMKFTQESYMRSQSTLLAYEIIDRMRANRDAARTGAYDVAAAPGAVETCGAPSAAGCATPADIANYDLSLWYQEQAKTLTPSATPASISRDAKIIPSGASTYTVYEFTVTMRWQEKDTEVKQEWVVEI